MWVLGRGSSASRNYDSGVPEKLQPELAPLPRSMYVHTTRFSRTILLSMKTLRWLFVLPVLFNNDVFT